MSLLMINIAGEKRDYIINKFISKRIPVFSADRSNEIQYILMHSEITHVYIDMSSVKNDWLDFLKQLRQTEGGSKYKIMVTSDRQDKEYIKELLMLGIVGFLPTTLDAERTYLKILKIFKTTDELNQNRKHFRVSVPGENPIKVNFRIPNTDKFITGKLTDLSIVAVAFRLDNPVDCEEIAVGNILDKVQLKINNKLALVNLRILKSGAITVGHIVETSENTMNLISQFIYHEMVKKVNGTHISQRVKA